MIFEVGGHYSNNIGEYIVLAIIGKTMMVQYLDGTEQPLSIAVQSKICENRNLRQAAEQQRHTKTHQKQQDSYRAYWTLGFLAQRIVHLGGNIITEKEDEFRDQYANSTGKELLPEQAGISFLREGANQWGNQGVLSFRAKQHELALLKFRNTPYSTNQPNIFEVKDIRFFWFALENGFQTGGKQDIPSIQNSILATDRDAFDKGYEYAINRGQGKINK